MAALINSSSSMPVSKSASHKNSCGHSLPFGLESKRPAPGVSYGAPLDEVEVPGLSSSASLSSMHEEPRDTPGSSDM